MGEEQDIPKIESPKGLSDELKEELAERGFRRQQNIVERRRIHEIRDLSEGRRTLRKGDSKSTKWHEKYSPEKGAV